MLIRWPMFSIGRRFTEVVSGLIQIGVGIRLELSHGLVGAGPILKVGEFRGEKWLFFEIFTPPLTERVQY
jgi:hypothetical protein